MSGRVGTGSQGSQAQAARARPSVFSEPKGGQAQLKYTQLVVTSGLSPSWTY